MTCATTGRLEHGTSRRSPGSSPSSLGIGWEYYRNLTAVDFRRAFALDKHFSYYRFWYNWFTFDLYFLGLRSGNTFTPEIKDGWDRAVNTISKSIAIANEPKVMRMRRIAAKLGGDGFFEISRRLLEKLNYFLNITG
jgi:hypothetical protein